MRSARRPAREVAEDGREELQDRFANGEVVSASQVRTDAVQKGIRLRVAKGSYWGAACELIGRVLGLELDKGQRYVCVEVQGTRSEELLRWATGSGGPVVRVHLCDDGCSGIVTGEREIHRGEVQLVPWDASEDWYTNAMPAQGGRGDEMSDLRKLMEAGEECEPGRSRRDGVEKAKARGKIKEGSSSSDGKKRKSKKKKKKARRERKRQGDQRMAKKDPKVLFEGTALDPDPSTRKRIIARAERLSKKRSQTSASTSSSSSSGSGEASGHRGPGLF